MKQIRDIMKYGGVLSLRKISEITGVSRPAVAGYLKSFGLSGLSLAQAGEMSDTELVNALREDISTPEKDRAKRLTEHFPDYVRRLKEKGMTLQILWEEYNQEDPQPYRYSRFCELFHAYCKDEPVTMHLEHRAGDRAFFDFAGEKVKIYDRSTGEEKECEFFVGILASSQLTYTEAVESQKVHDVITATENALLYFGGKPEAVVFDCLKSVVTKGSSYEPVTNARFDHFAEYCGTINLPARPNHPRDKALVEGAVRILYTRIYTELRKQKFFSLNELNREIHRLLEKHNDTPLTNLKISRRELFESTERATLKPLPPFRYEMPSFADAKVQISYHIYFREDNHYYSVPFKFKGKQARIVAGRGVVEIYIDGLRVATHPRKRVPGYSTTPEHMPSHHRFVSEMNPEKLIRMGQQKSDDIAEFVRQILEAKKHPEQGYRASLGVIHLTKKYPVDRVSRACRRAMHFKSISYRSVAEILEKGLESHEDDLIENCLPFPSHDNIRGSSYYSNEATFCQEACHGN